MDKNDVVQLTPPETHSEPDQLKLNKNPNSEFSCLYFSSDESKDSLKDVHFHQQDQQVEINVDFGALGKQPSSDSKPKDAQMDL
jgi:hypothetical protein